MRLILLGPPGAGKGTQSKVLAKELKTPHISTGDLLRLNVSQNTELGKKAKSFMDQGGLVPDELVTQMLIERIKQPDVENGFILDGYPRNINQAEALDKALKQKNVGIDLVVYLDTSEPVIVQRLSGRLVCSSCSANFHIKNMPPKQNMICDNCQGKLYQRTDDKEATIKERLKVYLKESFPLIKYYEEEHKLCRLSADVDAEVVLGQILCLSREYSNRLKVSK
jgi:adenylate kinase